MMRLLIIKGANVRHVGYLSPMTAKKKKKRNDRISAMDYAMLIAPGSEMAAKQIVKGFISQCEKSFLNRS